MQIYLARNNQQAGPYSLEQLNQMLANQQVLLTDLVWHQGMSEWKPLGELTQGKLFYQPQGFVQPNPISLQKTATPVKATQELASISSRALAKILDLLLWIPAAAIPSFFLTKEQVFNLQNQMQDAQTAEQMSQFQTQFWQMIPTEAWQAVLIYIFIMLCIQAFMIAKSGQSLGKKALKIKIVDAQTGEQVSLLRGFTLRSAIFIVLNIMFMPFITVVDYLFALNKTKQTLHDKLAKTKVIKKL